MEEKKYELRIVDFKPTWVVGCKTVVKQGQTATAFVKSFRTNGSNELLQKLSHKVSPDGDIVIWMGEYNGETKSFIEIPGVLVEPDSENTDGFDIRMIPKCSMAICTIKGKTRSLSKGAHNKLLKLLNGSEYTPDYSLGFSMEYYFYEKYEKENEEYEFSYLLPCKKIPR